MQQTSHRSQHKLRGVKILEIKFNGRDLLRVVEALLVELPVVV